MKPTILLDMDGVVVDLVSVWLKEYNRMYNDNLTADYLFLDWDAHERAKCGQAIYDIFKAEGFFENLPLVDGAYDGVQELMKISTVVLASAASNSAEIAKGKVLFVQKHLPFFNPKNMILCGSGRRKAHLRGDIMIDDSEKNLRLWEEANTLYDFEGYTIMVGSPSNRNSTFYASYKVNNWEQILQATRECIIRLGA